MARTTTKKATETKRTTAKKTAEKKTATKKATTAKKAASKKDTTKKKAKVIDLKSKREMEAPGMKVEAIEALVNAGFKRWQKGGHDRLYISAAKLGLKMDAEGTSFMGEPIDAKEGERMKAAKTFVNVHTGEVFSGNDVLEAAANALMCKTLSLKAEDSPAEAL